MRLQHEKGSLNMKDVSIQTLIFDVSLLYTCITTIDVYTNRLLMCFIALNVPRLYQKRKALRYSLT